MNINPKKSWHVRSKTNIAKVQRDEAKLVAEEAEKKRRLELAESDERWSLLKKSAKERGFGTGSEAHSVIDLFDDVKRGVDGVVAESKEYKDEKKRDQQEWEKKVGLLKFLGEGSAEFSAEKPWWTQSREYTSETSSHRAERDKSSKVKEDPLVVVNRSMCKKTNNAISSEVNSNVSSTATTSTSKSMDQLRRERLDRERKERERTQNLLASRGIIPQPKQTIFPSSALEDERKRPYNSAFNASLSNHLKR